MRQGAAERRGSGSRRIVVGVLSACVILLIIGPRIQPVANVISPIVTPVESTISGIANDIGTIVSSLTRLPTLERENRSLRKQIAMLDQQLAQQPLLRRELNADAHMLNFRYVNPHLDLLPAAVIGSGAQGLSQQLTINAGSNEGVRLENPVLDQYGFVIGKVTEVDQAESSAGLLTANNIDIPALDARTGAKGLVSTSVGGTPTINSVEIGQHLRIGDLVVTSGLNNEFPIGSLIGQITSVQGGSVLSLQSAKIRTAADMNNIQYVQVVRNFGNGVRVAYPTGTGQGTP